MDKERFEKARAELPILRSFIDFVNRQVGVYCDCMSSFRGNKVRIERQKARVSRPSGMRIKDGQPVIMRTSFEDPSSPDVIHQRIIKADDFVAANAEAGRFCELIRGWARSESAQVEQRSDPSIAAIDAEIADFEALIEARPGARCNNAFIDRGATREEGEPASGGSAKSTIQGCRGPASGRRLSCRNRGSISDAHRHKRRGGQIRTTRSSRQRFSLRRRKEALRAYRTQSRAALADE